MARARNIKPSFFTNELLVELHAFDRLLFIGLWCLADREGRVECRIKRIKMELFPCDTYDVDHGINELIRTGFLKKYTVHGVTVLSIVNFLKHQTPHGTEKDSDLPDENGKITHCERDNKGYASGKKRKNNVNTVTNNSDEQVKPPLENSLGTGNTQGTNALNHESGFLNPDILNHERGIGSPEKPLAVDNSEPEARAARLSLDFEFTDSLKAWCRASRAEIQDPGLVFKKFMDFYANGTQEKTIGGWVLSFKSFFLNERIEKPNIASVTVPSKPGPDPALARIMADAKKAVPVPFHERVKINKILAASKPE
jgi:hypothetical protein